MAGPAAASGNGETLGVGDEYMSRRDSHGTTSSPTPLQSKDTKDINYLGAQSALDEDDEEEDDEDEDEGDEDEVDEEGLNVPSPSLREEEIDVGSIMGRRDSIKVRERCARLWLR